MMEKDSIKSIEKCFNLLGCIYTRGHSLTLEELVKISGYKKTSCFRLLKTMLGLGILEQDARTKEYQFGPRLVSIGIAALKNMSLLKISLPILQKLRDETGETVNLSILNGTEIVFIERLMSNYIVNLNINVGDRLPIYCASMGKVILAFLSPENAERIMAQFNFEAKTKRTLVTLRALQEELAEIRSKGYAINDEELEIGLRAVAAPIFNHKGEAFAAINIAWTTTRHPSLDAFESFTPKITAAAEKISALMGYVMQKPRLTRIPEPSSMKKRPR
jgi:DNA-binding IclR family transcriptional regulator